MLAIAAQGVLFLTWILVSATILREVMRRWPGGYAGPLVQLAAWRATLADPATRRLRRAWLALTVLLLAASALWAS